MRVEDDWRVNATCSKLTPEQADELFFGGRGSKPHRAKMFCQSCPVKKQCLSEAVANKYQGFQAGTTEDDRDHMRDLVISTVNMLEMPPEPTGAEGTMLLIGPSTDHNWMDEVEPPEHLLAVMDTMSPYSESWDRLPAAI